MDQLSDFLSDLVLNTDKVIIVGDFNINVDIECDKLSVAFKTILDSIGFTQNVHKPMHCWLHTLDLVLAFGIDCEELTIFPHNPVLCDHFLITFEFNLSSPPPKERSIILDLYRIMMYPNLKSLSPF